MKAGRRRRGIIFKPLALCFLLVKGGIAMSCGMKIAGVERRLSKVREVDDEECSFATKEGKPLAGVLWAGCA